MPRFYREKYHAIAALADNINQVRAVEHSTDAKEMVVEMGKSSRKAGILAHADHQAGFATEQVAVAISLYNS